MDDVQHQLHRIRDLLGPLVAAIDGLDRLEATSWTDYAAASVDVPSYIASRRLRDRFFPGRLFADPAWDILLDLWLADQQRRSISVTSLCTAAAVPPSTALRWIGKMAEIDLLRCAPDPRDGRRTHVNLTPQARAAMRDYLAAVRSTGVLQPRSCAA